MQNKVSKVYSNTSNAKRSLRRIFGVGPFSSNYTHANARFCDGNVDGNTLTLSSNYWTESSLEMAFKIGIDKI